MDEHESTELTVASFHDLLQREVVTIEMIVEGYLDRIERYDRTGPSLNSVITVNQRALNRARALDDRIPNNGIDTPLYGVPVLIKDQAKTAGIRTTFGSTAFAEYVPETSATVVEYLEAAGAVILGKTNLPDFAAGFVGYSSVAGQTHNPYDLSRDSGGSSAGTGAGIAANLGMVGIGEDTGGSIRVPASFCNLFGMRVTTGLISRDGFSPLVREQDTAGPMCRTVDDLARVLDVIVGFDPSDTLTAVQPEWVTNEGFRDAADETSLVDTRIGVLRNAFGSDSAARSRAVTDVIESSLAELEKAGATLVDPVEIGGLETFLDETALYDLVAKRDLNTFFEELDGSPVESFQTIYNRGAYHNRLELVETIESAPVDPTNRNEYWWRLARQTAFRQRIRYVLASMNLDALAFPDVQVVPPRSEGYHTGELAREDVPTNTVIASQSGCPAISMPAGFTAGGLPVGIELLGAPFSDRKLVSFAAAYEATAEPRRPPSVTTPAR